MPYQGNGRIADLLRIKGVSKAGAILGSADAWSQGVQQTGQIAGDTIRGLMQAKRIEQDETMRDLRLKDAQRQETEAARAARGVDLERGLRSKFADPATGQISPENAQTVVGEMAGAGYGEEAQAWQTQRTDEANKQFAASLQRMNILKTPLAQGKQILAELEKNPALWSQYRPLLVDIAAGLSPELANSIPQNYDPAAIKQMVEFTTSSIQANDTALKAATKIQAARDRAVGAVEQEVKLSEGLGTLFSNATTAEAWQAQQQIARALGVSEQEIAALGEWTPEAPKRAAYMAMSPKEKAEARKSAAGIKPGQSGEFNFYMSDIAKKEEELGRPLTPTEEAAQWPVSVKNYAETRRAPVDKKAVADPFEKDDRQAYEDWVRAAPGGTNPDGSERPFEWLPYNTWRERNRGRRVPGATRPAPTDVVGFNDPNSVRVDGQPPRPPGPPPVGQGAAAAQRPLTKSSQVGDVGLHKGQLWKVVGREPDGTLDLEPAGQ